MSENSKEPEQSGQEKKQEAELEKEETKNKQITEMGDSFILAPSCTLPANMPAANIDALYAAIEDE